MDRLVKQYARTPVLSGFSDADDEAERELRQQMMATSSASSSSMSIPRFELPKVENVGGK